MSDLADLIRQAAWSARGEDQIDDPEADKLLKLAGAFEWSADDPTEPGYYWLREGDAEPEVVHVDHDWMGDGLAWFAAGSELPQAIEPRTHLTRRSWAGPLVPPS